MVISISVILTIELAGSPSDGHPYRRLFPMSILPLSDTHSAETGLIYDWVGYAVLTADGTHFKARYISSANSYKSISAYDGMHNGGWPVWLPHNTLDTVMDPGDQLYQAFYYLRGGMKAQQMFIETRAGKISEKHNLDLSNTDLSLPISVTYGADHLHLLNPKLRSWMKDPYCGNSAEYVLKDVPWLPRSPSVKVIESESEEPAEILLLPDSLFDLNCRCGTTGDGNMLYNVLDTGGNSM